MIRLILFLGGVAAAAACLAWLADRPGTLVITWQGYDVETSVFRAVVLLAALAGLCALGWSILRQIWLSPAIVGGFIMRRRQERGLDALSSGLIAVGAGDRDLALRYAAQARRALPNEPLTHLLRAQAAQLAGDRGTTRRIFEAMLAAPDTEQLGLRGLFLEAERTGEPLAARQFAQRALALNPTLAWPADALFELQCMAADWEGALDTLSIARRHGHVDRGVADRRRAILLTARAQDLEDSNSEAALNLALEASALAPDLVPAAAIAGRGLASRGSTAKAARVLEKTWKRAPHPDLAVAYAYARPGDSPRDRLERVRRLSRLAPHSIEGPIAVANAAIEARDWDAARHALEPLLEARLTQRVCTLMARIEGAQRNDAGRVREWLARAVNAPRDPVWTADGVVSERWEAISPKTGRLDAFEWRVPVQSIETESQELVAARLEELVGLGSDAALETQVIQVASGAGSVAAPRIGKFEATLSSELGGAPVEASEAGESSGSGASKTTDPLPSVKGTSVQPKESRTEARPAAEASAPSARHKSKEPRIFVPPHAPDDPGPDEATEGVAVSHRGPDLKWPP